MHAATLIMIGSLAQHGGAPPAPAPAPPAAAPAPPAAVPAPPALAPAPGSPPDRIIKVPPGFEWDLYAWEPLVADPVAFAIDEQGRIFLAESERQERGVEDNRHQPYWLLDDLTNETVEDRLRMYEKWAEKREGGMDHYTRWADRVRVLLDPGEDGRPTRSVNFSGDFREPLDGTNAGVLARDGEVWVTCIPTLWRFRDTDGDGVADERDRIFDGFGVRIALRGHDMHGLVFGPDGRLYWSIGDRGYHVTLPDGRVLADPKSGAVFRCEPDGTNLEVFCTGLRNPQELAFNRFGDLFTGDNNSDAGDKARIVWCVDGGETGWDMNYQTVEGANQRGPWNQERIWKLWSDEDATDPLRAAWTLPPLAHVGSGPSGLVAYPGTGLDERYRDALFMCDFLGDRRSSRVLAMTVERDGAGYTVTDVHPFVSDVLTTDVDFDWHGRMVISDWDATWESNGKGQIYRVWDPRFANTPEARDLAALVAKGFRDRSDEELARLLAHPDMRVRLRAQWELAKRFPKSVPLLAPMARADLAACRTFDIALDALPIEARLHAIWGLGQQLRALERTSIEAQSEERQASIDGAAELSATLVSLLGDEDAEIRTQAARVLGEAATATRGERNDALRAAALDPLIGLATDEDPRVRMAAATALGRLGSKEAIPALVAILWENEDSNPYLRQAAAVALARIGDRDKLLELAADPFPQVRMGAVLALRRLHDPALARSLFDPELRIATEAARAIHDLPIAEAQPSLVLVAERWPAHDRPGSAESNAAAVPLLRRAITACLRDGSRRAAVALLAIAADDATPEPMRREALEALAEWREPSVRDRVIGHVRPIDPAPRDADGYRASLSNRLPALVESGPDALRTIARGIAEREGIALDGGAALATLRDAKAPPQERAQCLAQLVRQGHQEAPSLIALALESDAPVLRIAAREALAQVDAAAAVPPLDRALAGATLAERQAAIALLAKLARDDADAILDRAIRAAGSSPTRASDLASAIELDLLDAAISRGASLRPALEAWRGGPPPAAVPPRLGPVELYRDMALLGGDSRRGHELVNFHSAAACLRCHALDGHGGNAAPALDGIGARLTREQILRSLIEPNHEIAEGYTAPSAMPDMTTMLTPRQVRDVVEFLHGLRTPAPPSAPAGSN